MTATNPRRPLAAIVEQGDATRHIAKAYKYLARRHRKNALREMAKAMAVEPLAATTNTLKAAVYLFHDPMSIECREEANNALAIALAWDPGYNPANRLCDALDKVPSVMSELVDTIIKEEAAKAND